MAENQHNHRTSSSCLLYSKSLVVNSKIHILIEKKPVNFILLHFNTVSFSTICLSRSCYSSSLLQYSFSTMVC